MRWLALVLLTLGGAAFVALSAPMLTAPFGNSHDGRNAGVWASGSRALREDGPVASRLGGVHEDGSSYANHPPLIYLESAAVEWVAGEHPWTSKAPALLSALGAMVLLYLVLVNAGLRRVPAALGVVVGLLTPMMIVYGSMLDTPMTSLVFGVAVLLAWQRQWQGRPLPIVATGLLAVLACLSGWQAMLLTWLAVGSLVLRRPRRPADLVRGLRDAMPLLVGAVIGTVATVAWATWVYGSMSVLYGQLVRRSSNDAQATRLRALDNQSVWVVNLLSTALLGLVAAVVSLFADRRIRPLAALLLTTTLVYPVVLYNGAYYHEYWNYWVCLPVSCGAGWALDQVWSRLARHGASPRGAAALVGVLALVLIAPGVITETPEAQVIDAGLVPGRLAADAPFDPSQGFTGDIGATNDAASWLGYDARLPARHFDDADTFLAFAAEHPDAQILVSNACGDGRTNALCRTLAGAGQADTDPVRWRIATSADLAADYRQRTGG